MLNPIINSTFSEITQVASKMLYDKAFKAKEKHDQHQFNPNDPIEVSRNKCISKIYELQHQVVLCVTHADFLEKVMPLLLEHVVNVYEADSHQEFGIIDMSLTKIENAINSYNNEKERRKRIRMTAVVVSLVSLLSIGLFLWYGSTFLNISANTTINILSIPVPVLIWSILGSFAAILYRFTNAGDKELNEPLRWLFARPLTGIVMGVISYLVLKVGLVTIQGAAGNIITNPEVIWLIAFLAGFSDRFSESLLRTVVGKFGGDKDGELVSMEMRSKSTTLESHSPILKSKEKKNQEENLSKEVALSKELDKDLLVDQPGASIPVANPEKDEAPASSVTKVKSEEIKISQTKTDTERS